MTSSKTQAKARRMVERALKRIHRKKGIAAPDRSELDKCVASTMPFVQAFAPPNPPRIKRKFARGVVALLPQAGSVIGICDICGEEKNLTDHHIVPRAEWPFRVGDFENLVAPACPECHQLTHEHFSNMCLAEMPWDAVREAMRVILHLMEN